MSAPTPKELPAATDRLEQTFVALALLTLALIAASADRVRVLPPSLDVWLEIAVAIGVACPANGVLALLLERSASVYALGLCGLNLAAPFAVGYRFGISASAHALISFIGAWKSVDVLAGTCPPAIGSGRLAFAAHMISPVEFCTDKEGAAIVAAAPGQWRRQLTDVGSRYAGLAAATSLRRAFAAAGPFPSAPLELYAEVWSLYLFLSLFTSTFATALAASGFSPQIVFRSPLLRTTSVSDFWSRRWNLLIHGLFRRSVFRPLMRRHCPAWAAGAAAFAISGAFHEYAFAPHQPELAASAGRVLGFFLAQAPVVSLDRWARGQAALSPPWPFRTSSLACTAAWTLVLVPLAPLFMHPLKTSGVFEQIDALAPRLAFDV